VIRRPYQDGYLLIPQPAHAWISGKLASHWGNEHVSRPKPFEAVTLASTLHDVGWLEKDGLPLLHDDSHPLNFLDPSLDDVEGMYMRCASHAMQIDPYVGWLVNRHVQLIFNSKLTSGDYPVTRIQARLDELQTQADDLIQRMQTHPEYEGYLDEATLDHNYRILRICDLLSLFVCGAFPARTISNVPLRYGEPSIPVECKLLDDHTLHLSEALFDEGELSFYLDARVIPQQQYESAEAYQEAFENAAFVTLKKSFVCGRG
jgi:hypothetical protein